MSKLNNEYRPYLEKYQSGEWRAITFRDLVLHDAKKIANKKPSVTFLDIGCGGGFDGDRKLQDSLAQFSDTYIGVEPDTEMEPSSIFELVYPCFLEDAPIPPGSVDVAFSVMVLEHVEHVEIFWDKIYDILSPGGVCWGFTVDKRHWFSIMSSLMEKIRIKDLYLNILYGKRGVDRYENYPVFYRANSPKKILKDTKKFSEVNIINFHRVGQIDYYFPKKTQWIIRLLDRLSIKLGLPGSILAVRVKK